MVGPRPKGPTRVMRDMVSYWFKERWPDIVHLGVDRTLLGGGVVEQFKEFALPSLRC